MKPIVFIARHQSRDIQNRRFFIGKTNNGSRYNSVSQKSTQEQELKHILRRATRVPEEMLKVKFAKIYGGKIRIAPPPKGEFESMQEFVWRYLVVRSAIAKQKTKQIKYVPKKYLPK